MNPAQKLETPADPGCEVRHSLDYSLSSAGIHLIGRLEQLLVALQETPESERMAATVSHSEEMLVEIIDAVEGRLGQESIGPFVDRIGGVHGRAKALVKELNGNPWQGLTKLAFGKPQPRNPEQQQTFTALVEDFLSLFGDCFAAFRDQFHSSQRAQQWEETYLLFLSELRKQTIPGNEA